LNEAARDLPAPIGALTAAEVDEKCPVEVLVVDEGRVDAGARLVVDAEVVELRVPAKEVASLVVHHELLDEPLVLLHVEVEAGRRLAGPETNSFLHLPWYLCVEFLLLPVWNIVVCPRRRHLEMEGEGMKIN
jgi:hypothetical protein